MIFITNGGVMDDKNVRLAMCHAVDKETIIKRLLRGYGTAISTLEAPGYAAFDPTIKVSYDAALAKKMLAASGYSKEKPVKFTIQTTRGYKPKDYEMIQAIVGMWRNVGIDANIEIYEIAKHFELRMSHKLAPAAFYNWGNAIGDPTTSTGFAMWSKSPHSAWHSADLDAKIGPYCGPRKRTSAATCSTSRIRSTWSDRRSRSPIKNAAGASLYDIAVRSPLFVVSMLASMPTLHHIPVIAWVISSSFGLKPRVSG